MKPYLIVLGALCSAVQLVGQTVPPAVAAERAAFTEWLVTSPNSPFAVVVQRRIGEGLTIGPPQADVPLDGLALHRVSERGGVPYLNDGAGDRPLARFRQTALGSGEYKISIIGTPGRSTAIIYRPAPRQPKPPTYYPYQTGFSLTVTLDPPSRPRDRRILAADGSEVLATEAGTVRVMLEGKSTSLQVYRVPDVTGEEAELEIYFRDATNDHGTYPAGRFVTLDPLGGTRYRLDFNRARNPFCAYSSVFACPIPWRGNLIESAIEAGEKYSGGGLQLTPPGEV
jgi:hypothetical protein